MSKDNQILQQRREKAEALEELGVKLYTNSFKPANIVSDLLPKGENLEAQQHDESGETFSLAGRIMSMRKFGKAAFIHLADRSGQLQIYLKKDILGEDEFARFKKWDIGDIVGVTGTLFKTKVGELSLQAGCVNMVSKSMRPLPEKWHGLTDVETRYRQRYVDLIVTPESRDTFRKRVEIIRLVREFLNAKQFMEVETPMMQAVPGGATAKPFQTHHNALGMDLFLRVAPELYLKRLLVGGFERVFEINRNFRNEGLSTRHNPEFTMLEFYQAYATYDELMDLTEEMISSICEKVNGSMQIEYQGVPVNLAPPWKRMTMDEALIEVAGIDAELLKDEEAVLALAKEKGIKLEKQAGAGKAKTELFEELVEEKLIDPTFITSYPTEVSPLARRNEDDATVTDRFELFVTGREIANAFSELNDPVDQRERFQKQIDERGDDDEIHPEMDNDYIRALEYGMPSAAGEGIGIDRLVMLLTDSPSIRDVILFPHLKPEVKLEEGAETEASSDDNAEN
ncbi:MULTISPECIES: lysine--tRNA ligase [Desulfosediminicola]|uniref:lysine--tRNA ligase n=1 Tax=Desulfosediminicola TaxID=2886823 RepID=UPI0010AB73F8|nr:lysine--tRNA ligase [Desulfosediminicola ganghwensis]